MASVKESTKESTNPKGLPTLAETTQGIAATELRPWGSFTVLEEGTRYKIKRIEVKPGHRLS
ncbi:MAG: mannose-6-phosphate isomerase, partial [Phormidium sp. GEM2.Bin31]